MKHNLWFARWLLCALLLALGSSTPISAGGDGELVCSPQDGPIAPDCPVSNVIGAFNNIPEQGGQPVHFYWGAFGKPDFGPWLRPCKHFQGIASIVVNGTQYYFLTKSGNKTDACKDSHNDPGELWVFKGNGDSPVAVERIFFNGSLGWPGWMHPGGVQLVDGVLVVPVEHPWPEDVGGGGILLIDVQDPESPVFLKQIAQFSTSVLGAVGLVAVTKMEDGRYLFAVSGGDYDRTETVGFGRSSTTDLRDPNLTIDLYDIWNSSELGTDENKWDCGRNDVYCDAWQFQTLNFVRDTNGTLYIVGTDKDLPITGGQDWVRLFRVVPVPGNTSLFFSAERHLDLGDPEHMGSLDAVGGVYVNPNGKLFLYTGSHDGNDSFAPGGRFESTYLSDTTPPVTIHTLAGTLGEHDWYQSAVQVTLSASDTCASGVQLTQYRVDGGAWQDYIVPFALSAGGSHTVRYRSQDKAGNWETEKQASFRIDTTAPTGSIRLNDGASSTHSALVRVYLSASDADSGVWQMRLRDAGGAWAAWQAYDSNVFWQLPNPATDQTYTVEVQFKDVAGHTSEIYSDAITLDINPARPASASYRLAKSTWGASGSPASSASYRLENTLGQPSMIGLLSSASYGLSSGFWDEVMYRVFLPIVLRNH